MYTNMKVLLHFQQWALFLIWYSLNTVSGLTSTAYPPVPGYTHYPLQNCILNDITSNFYNTASDCASDCNSNPACVAFVFQYQLVPPHFCYLKNACDVGSLFTPGSDIHTYIQMEVTTQADLSSTTLTFDWFTYTVNSDVKEAPYAMAIGAGVIILLIVFLIFLIVLDLNNYRISIKRGYRNCVHGIKSLREKLQNNNNNNDDKETVFLQTLKPQVDINAKNGIVDK